MERHNVVLSKTNGISKFLWDWSQLGLAMTMFEVILLGFVVLSLYCEVGDVVGKL